MSAPRNALPRQLVARARRALACLGPRRITAVHLADPKPGPERDAEFGLLVLDDGSAGLYYAWLAGEQAHLPQRLTPTAIIAGGIEAALGGYLGDDDAARSVGLATINAISASFLRAAGWSAPAATDSFAGLDPQAGDCIGMIGNFPPLVRRANAAGIAVRVVEHKPHMVTRQRLLEISLDPAVLAPCNKLVCTGATLINHSFEAMRAHWPADATVAVIGPSVSCFPDDLFALGADIIAGTEIVDGHAACDALAAGRRLGELSRRTLVRRSDYPGFDALAARISQAAE